MLRLDSLNKLIQKEIGPDIELVRGDGYFWVNGPGFEQLYSNSIYVFRLNQLNADQWLREVRAKFNEVQSINQYPA